MKKKIKLFVFLTGKTQSLINEVKNSYHKTRRNLCTDVLLAARSLNEKLIRFVHRDVLTLTWADGFEAITLSQHLIRLTTQFLKT